MSLKKFWSIFSKDEQRSETEPAGSLDEQEMIQGVVELPTQTVKEVLVPRIDTVFIDIDTPTKELLDKVASCGHSRLPVYRDTIDNVIGVLYVKDLLNTMVKSAGKDISQLQIESIIRKAYFVPESKRLDSLLREFQKKRVHIAVAVDEYGGVSGIVCMEDIIEEIVGDIQDEFDNEEEEILKLEEGIYLCDARVSIEDLNETLGIRIPGDEVDTLGGFVFEKMGKIPVKFEKVTFDNITFIIQNVEGHKIKSIKLDIKGLRDIEE